MSSVLSFLHGWVFLLAAFGVALTFAMAKGRQGLINLIMGSYLGLFLFQSFPWLQTISNKAQGERTEALALLALFAVFTIFSTWLFSRLMPREYLETAFETMGKKLLLAFAAMVLIMTLSTHYLPIDSIISTGTPLPASFLAENVAYLWLLLPLAVLFLI